ncbi:MAG: SRPBCC family protein [Verrucomicrobium sp.]|nr:SRPBCC family protein [Verrucomicrobium sp.]
MHAHKQIEIAVSREEAFALASDLERWPEFLPHYRSNEFLTRAPGGDGGIVKMACVRSGIPLSWVSVYRADAARLQMRFQHLKPLTRGMEVRWEFTPSPHGVRVEIIHDFELDWPLVGPWIADAVVGRFLIDHVAGLTLEGLKARLEGGS